MVKSVVQRFRQAGRAGVSVYLCPSCAGVGRVQGTCSVVVTLRDLAVIKTHAQVIYHRTMSCGHPAEIVLTP